MRKIAWICCVFMLTVACLAWGANETGEGSKLTLKEVLEKHTDTLMALPGVIGTAQGLCDGTPCIKVYVIEKTPQLEQRIYHILAGYPVSVEQSGAFRALPDKKQSDP